MCSGNALLGDLLGVSRSMERDLSVLSIYPRIFLLRVFIVYRLFVGFLFCVAVFYYMYTHVCLLFGFSCQYLPSDWLERLL